MGQGVSASSLSRLQLARRQRAPLHEEGLLARWPGPRAGRGREFMRLAQQQHYPDLSTSPGVSTAAGGRSRRLE